MVIDLDPGPGRSVVDCCRVALLLRERLGADGIETWAKTSGSKGLHLYAALRDADSRQASDYARGVARELERAHPDRVVSRMTKADRTGRVFIDWSQNSAKKTTATPYTVRARPEPAVSTPLAWSEVESAATPEDLAFTLTDLAARLADHGDLLAPLLARDAAAPLP
ncbi:non-homologous end-joining DNA ligase LigD [Streptomyces sp. IBSBF 2435]|uniref:non-homologous end-joining DNA ligase LigD n=1 Tax=Streptomyces sp. IBSBF 2435 TaxID=2903531 RepID=UPI003FA7397E